MRRKFFLLFAVVLLIASAHAAENPKLIVAIAVDQFRYDYLLRFRSEYKEGLDRLLTRGAVFANALLNSSPSFVLLGLAVIVQPDLLHMVGGGI